MKKIRIVLIAENISVKMGGEAAQILIYFRKFRERNIDVWLVCHERVKDELRKELSEAEYNKACFVEETSSQRFLWNIGKNFPTRLQELLIGQMINLLFQFKAKKHVKRLIRRENIEIVFQPTPNTPKLPSLMYDLGVPVIIGPMKGGMDFPPAFKFMDSVPVRLGLALGNLIALALNRFIPGKLLAKALIVGDEKTKEFLPRKYRGRVVTLLECGVDLTVWQGAKDPVEKKRRPVRFVFTGRLVDWKGVRFLIEAFRVLLLEVDACLEIVGDGPLSGMLKNQAASSGIDHCIKFHGWLDYGEMLEILTGSDVFVMSSLRESCGCSILEAMALALPVIAVDWGGPARILNSACGILVKPDNYKSLVHGFTHAMKVLADSPELRKKMGNAGKAHLISNYFDWDSKVDRLINIFMESLDRGKIARPDAQFAQY